MLFRSDRSGGLWIGTSGQGLWYSRDPQTTGDLQVETVTTLTGLSNDIVNSLIEDRDGNIWVGTADGLNRLRRHPFTSITNFGAVTGLEASPDGSVWASTPVGIVRFTDSGQSTRQDILIRDVQPRAMHMDRQGSLWLATDDGVRRYDPRGGGVAATLVTDTLRRVRSISSTAQGDVWFYDLDRGLGHWHEGTLDIVALPTRFEHALICSILADGSGRTWIGLRQEIALVRFADGTFGTYGAGDGYTPGTCNALAADHNGNIWTLGLHGLSRFADGHFMTLRRPGEVPLESLQGMVEDNSGAIWLSSWSGITRMQPDDMTQAFDGHWDRVRATIYDGSNGVSGKAARNARSAVRATDGRLWFLTSRGVTIVDPNVIREAPSTTPVHIDVVTVDDQRLGMPAQLKPRSRRVEVDYSLATLTPGPRPRFRYRLDGALARADQRSAPRSWTLIQPDWWVDTSTVARRRALVPAQREVWLRHRRT